MFRKINKVGVDQAAEQSPPLARDTRPAELGEAGDELRPGQDGQAARLLEDRHERAAAVDRQHGHGAILGVPAQPPAPPQRGPQRRRRALGLAPEPLDEPLEGVPRQPDRAVVVLTGRGHRSPAPAAPAGRQ
jgi:hypothetical protein